MRSSHYTSSQAAIALWVLLPILGPLSAVAWLILLPFGARNSSSRIPWLHGLFYVCLLYAAYLLVRAMVAKPDLSILETLRDLMPLLIITGVAAWTLRRAASFDLSRWFKFLCVSLLVVLGLTVLERAMLADRYQSQLLLGNPLNLTPLLVVPALLCTYSQFAANERWRWIGLGAFAASAFVISGVSMTRGPFIVMTALVMMRILLILFSGDSFVRRLKTAAIIALLFALTFLATLLDQSTMNRFERLFNTTLELGKYASSVEKDRPSSATDVDLEDAEEYNSVSERFVLVLAGWHAFKEKPMLGHGPQFRFEAAVPYLPKKPTESYSHLHNDFVTHLVAGGVVACGLLLAILSAPLVASFGSGANRRPRLEIGLLFSLNFMGTAVVNNVLFVWVSAFTLAISMVAALVIIDSLAIADETSQP